MQDPISSYLTRTQKVHLYAQTAAQQLTSSYTDPNMGERETIKAYEKDLGTETKWAKTERQEVESRGRQMFFLKNVYLLKCNLCCVFGVNCFGVVCILLWQYPLSLSCTHIYIRVGVCVCVRERESVNV